MLTVFLVNDFDVFEVDGNLLGSYPLSMFDLQAILTQQRALKRLSSLFLSRAEENNDILQNNGSLNQMRGNLICGIQSSRFEIGINGVKTKYAPQNQRD